MKRYGFLLLPFLLSLSACAPRTGQAPATNAARRAPSPTVTPANTPAPLPPLEGQPAEGSGSLERYKFTYKRTGDNVTVTFSSPKLPWKDTLVVAVARQIITSAYGDESENFPRPLAWNYQGAHVNAIKLEGAHAEYVFLPLKDETKKETPEISTLLFWRLAKGAIK